jgi:hypothetical protein
MAWAIMDVEDWEIALPAVASTFRCLDEVQGATEHSSKGFCGIWQTQLARCTWSRFRMGRKDGPVLCRLRCKYFDQLSARRRAPSRALVAGNVAAIIMGGDSIHRGRMAPGVACRHGSNSVPGRWGRPEGAGPAGVRGEPLGGWPVRLGSRHGRKPIPKSFGQSGSRSPRPGGHGVR